MARQRAESHAHELLVDHGIVNPPVDVERLAVSAGAVVRDRRFKGDPSLSGVLIREDGRAVIGVNSMHAPTRRRFTIAHELGHLVMHPGRPLIIDSSVRVNRRDRISSTATDLEEIEANQFAAALLMPASMVIEELERVVEHTPALRPADLAERLADIFDVSQQAMGFRLVNLGVLSAGDLS